MFMQRIILTSYCKCTNWQAQNICIKFVHRPATLDQHCTNGMQMFRVYWDTYHNDTRCPCQHPGSNYTVKPKALDQIATLYGKCGHQCYRKLTILIRILCYARSWNRPNICITFVQHRFMVQHCTNVIQMFCDNCDACHNDIIILSIVLHKIMKYLS